MYPSSEIWLHSELTHLPVSEALELYIILTPAYTGQGAQRAPIWLLKAISPLQELEGGANRYPELLVSLY